MSTMQVVAWLWPNTDVATEDKPDGVEAQPLVREADALAAIKALEADRDSWHQQASDRLDDALRFAKERDEALAALKAARAETLEEAAQLCEAHATLCSANTQAANASDECAIAIRRLLGEAAGRGASAAKEEMDEAPEVPEGWQLVPIEPTPEMCEADWNVSMSDAHTNHGVSRCAWAAMLAAAPAFSLGEDAGRGESDLDDDGEPIKRCSVCGDPVRYGSRHHGCAPVYAGDGGAGE